MEQKELFSKRSFFLFICIGIALNALCFFSEILEPDGALYATIAKHIANTNDWINLWGNGSDWLDKPHLPFWLAAISFKLFGISAFSYKLASFVCWLVAVLYCYKLSAKIYSIRIAQLATIIYITALHVILSNADVRAEGYLTTFILAATYYIYKAYTDNKFIDILLAALFCAGAIMTKGIFTIVTITSGLIIYWIKNKEWKEFIKLKWYLFVILLFIFILPELYCLYTQFDLHPEKIIFGKTHVSGIHFFFWDSQFGRFANNGPIKGSGDIFFFLHTTLWAFLPWSVILLIILLGSLLATLINSLLFSFPKSRVLNYVVVLLSSFKKQTSLYKHGLIISGSALITFLLFSFSKFQLPHYIVIIFPHLAMIIAYWLLERSTEKMLLRINTVQTVLYILLSVLVITIVYYTGFISIIVPIGFCITIALITFSDKQSYLLSICKKSIGFAVLFAFFFNCMFYHTLLKYQAGMMAGKWMNENYKDKPVVMYQCNDYSFEFYCKGNVGRLDTSAFLKQREFVSSTYKLQLPVYKDTLFFFTPLKRINELIKYLPDDKITVLNSFSNFHVSQVTLPFLNKETRKNVLDTLVIATITQIPN
jgi:4-amino-4-deoxy-L-arabinose transferase-like glycosyltransferase